MWSQLSLTSNSTRLLAQLFSCAQVSGNTGWLWKCLLRLTWWLKLSQDSQHGVSLLLHRCGEEERDSWTAGDPDSLLQPSDTQLSSALDPYEREEEITTSAVMACTTKNNSYLDCCWIYLRFFFLLWCMCYVTSKAVFTLGVFFEAAGVCFTL